jgi:hypothetical protein
VEDYQPLFEEVRLALYRHMATLGYLERIERAGSELSRWREYLERLGQPGRAPVADPMAQPTIFPMMPDLLTSPWREAREVPAAAVLERSVEVFLAELANVGASRRIDYPSVIVANGQWSVMPVFAFGAETGGFLYPDNPFRQTAQIIRSLPDACPDLPLADFVFSAHAPHTHLRAHCSWDPFRLRLHLGLRVPDDCFIRVGRETRLWREGGVLAFHDSYEHETWNESDERRVVLIVDLWHSGLTAAERQAILACMRKKEIRSALMMTRAPVALQPLFEAQFAREESRDPLVAAFWN